MTTMNKQITVLLLSFLALLSITAPASEAASRKGIDNPNQQAGTPHDLTIFFSNDVKGETEPCG